MAMTREASTPMEKAHFLFGAMWGFNVGLLIAIIAIYVVTHP